MSIVTYVGLHNPVKFFAIRKRIISIIKESGLVYEDVHYQRLTSLFFLNNPLLDKTSIIMMFVDQDIFDQYSSYLSLANFTQNFEIPIVLVLRENNATNREKYYKFNIAYFVEEKSSRREIINVAKVALKNVIKLNNINKQIDQTNILVRQKVTQLDILKKYVPVGLWEKIDNLAENQDLVIPEEEEDITILSLDLVGFTSKSEILSPRNTIMLINDCFNIVEKEIYAHNGDIDKFIGDAVIAIFDNAKDAILTAINIQDQLTEFNKSLKKKIIWFFTNKRNEPIEVRIGIHKGRTIRGKVGGENRYASIIIGHALTITEQLQTSCPVGDILVSKQAVDSVGAFSENVPYTQCCISENEFVLATEFYKFYKNNENIQKILQTEQNYDNSMS